MAGCSTSTFSPAEIETFQAAIHLAEQYYRGQLFYPTDVDLLLHSLNCANKVAELHLYADAVTATILYAFASLL